MIMLKIGIHFGICFTVFDNVNLAEHNQTFTVALHRFVKTLIHYL